MKCKTAYLIINPRLGKNVAKLADIIALFAAAGWKTDTALKEFGGHTMQLAKEGAEAGYDLIVGYGGDGTLNQVVNGVMAAKRSRSIVAVIPGGTANVWAHEIGMPEDPVKATLLLINSEDRKVDLGHVEVDYLGQKKGAISTGGRRHFLLMAGLGVDAAILNRVNSSLKEKIGGAAVALATVKTLPSQHAFPIEIRTTGEGREDGVLWKGEALQVIVGNTRRYGNIAELTPEAHIDDGALDVCVITAGDPLTTIEQIVSFLLYRKHDNGHSESFQGPHFRITVPASIELQLDGSRVKRKDAVSGTDRVALKQVEDPKEVMVTYRFDAMPRALRVAIPRTYEGALFENGSQKKTIPVAEPKPPKRPPRKADRPPARQDPERVEALMEHGRKVTVVAVGPNPERKGTSIVAGGAVTAKSGESKPVAVRIDRKTTLVRPSGEYLPPAAVAAELREGGVIVVEGKQTKRGVIRAKQVVVGT
jgi:YegS/Rv2252/BmrU family lipid kinase